MSAELHFDERGLIPAIVQDRLTGELRMVAWMNQEALARTIDTGKATFYSRSRQTLWQKGESSGNHLVVHEIVADCDADVLLLLCEPAGPSCHTQRPGCFFRYLRDGALHDEPLHAVPFLQRLEREIAARRHATSAKSYTKSLLEGGAPKIGMKLREEASELAVAIEGESDERVVSEAADLVYHLLVGLALRDVPWRDVMAELSRRFGTSGHVEKARRQ